MKKKVLIDMIKLRDYEDLPVDAVFTSGPVLNGLRTIREEATFEFTCRRCEDAPCISVCPADALEKEGTGRVVRNINLCVRCKSCIMICPFGTLMDDLFEIKPRNRIFDLDDEKDLEAFIRACPEETVTLYEGEEDPGEHIYRLNDRVCVKELVWNQ